MANLTIGIVGLPNVGKSTLFNALLKKQVALAANYPFATIEPNVGVVEVPDGRLEKLADVIGHGSSDHPGGIPPATPEESFTRPPVVSAVVQFYDIAGLVAGASKGEGLGNKFLSHIREVAAIAHVIRLFEDKDVAHVSDKIDPKSDIETIEQELILADLGTLEKQREPKINASKEEIATYQVSQKLKTELDKVIPARQVDLTDDEQKAAKPLNLISAKPVIYVFNVSEKQLENKVQTEKQILDAIAIPSTPREKQSQDEITTSSVVSLPAGRQAHNDKGWLYLCAKMENDMASFSDSEQKEYLDQFGLAETGLARLAQKAYETLGLISFLTAGVKEVRAWTVTRGTLAPQAAGVIHTDFEKNFIKADVARYEDFVALGGWQKCREAGKVTLAGKDYVMKDGDVVEFKVGV